MRYLAAVLVVLTLLRPVSAAVVETDAVTYHLQTPKDYDTKKTYRLVVAVHGRTGTGQYADGIARAFWNRGHDVIVVGPNMPWGSGPGKDKQADGHAAMVALLKDVRAKHKLQEKYVLTGFSQGGYFTCDYGPKHESELLMAVYLGSTAPGNWIPKNLPIAGGCGSTEAFGPGIKSWAEKTIAAGGYALYEITDGAGHTVTEPMMKMMVDLFEKCHKGLHPRVLEQVEAKFAEAKKLEESQKFKEAGTRYKSVLVTKGLPDDLKQQAKDGQLKATLSEMAKANPQIEKTWDESGKTIAAAIKDFPGVLEFRKLLDAQRGPFRGAAELDSFFTQAETASQIISHINLHMKDVDAATAKGGKGPAQKLLNKKLLPLLEKIDSAEIKAALEPHLKKLPEPVA